MSLGQHRISTIGNYAGTTVRYAFFVVATVVLAMLGIVLGQVWGFVNQPSRVGTTSSLQIASSDLARLPVRGNTATFGAGWQEVLQYGQVHDRDTDFTLVMTMPARPDVPTVHDYSSEMSSLRPLLRSAFHSRGLTAYYDLETRFGPVRAANFQIDSDGRTKLCVSYLSRFDTTALYLKGWLCEASGARPNFHSLACMLDRIALKGPLPSAAAQSFLEERMKRPARCTAAPVSQTTDTRPARRPRRL